jgi:hypothetical protein
VIDTVGENDMGGPKRINICSPAYSYRFNQSRSKELTPKSKEDKER